MPDAGRTLGLMFAVAIALGGAAQGCASSEQPAPVAPPDSTTASDHAVVLSVTSSAFEAGGTMPAKYCTTAVSGGQNVSPPLAWTGVEGARSYAVVMIDRHPVANGWVHWIVVDLPAGTLSLPEGASGTLPSPVRELRSTFGSRGYGGPQPPAGTGDHPYEISVYALDVTSLDVPAAPSADEIAQALKGHVVGAGSLSAYYGR